MNREHLSHLEWMFLLTRTEGHEIDQWFRDDLELGRRAAGQFHEQGHYPPGGWLKIEYMVMEFDRKLNTPEGQAAYQEALEKLRDRSTENLPPL